MSESRPIVLQTKNLVAGYRLDGNDFALFDNLNLTLRKGELVCFMGSNGIGKTTLIKTLAGLQKPLQGFTEFHSHGSVALVLTDKITSSTMTVYDLVSYGRYPYLNWNIRLSAQDQKLIEESIKQVHLEALTHKRIAELSDGQLQMAMLAKALAQDTPILFLDEPTAHLDLNNRVEIMNLLRTLCRTSGKTVLVATHELDLALQTADRIWLATAERKILEGVPEDLVLNGTFDTVFQFKGFDLKSGKVSQVPYRKKTVQLEGHGYEYLWTKNALERSGYEVNTTSTLKIKTTEKDNSISWNLLTENVELTFDNLEGLLEFLKDT
ncbi:MAG: ABC transporter ATP-binding protein [Cyclobacteriaceae bacterium]|nr:ABC transporter ATP-binding protein [Cyclobacteriaceae bacterium]